MIPCLYDISETSYVTNGIGKLADCISCVVTEKRNGSYELKMEYPSDGIHADEITEGNIILAKPSDGAASQPFRIYKITTPMDGNQFQEGKQEGAQGNGRMDEQLSSENIRISEQPHHVPRMS